MFYTVPSALYDLLLARLTDAIGDGSYFSGVLTFDFDTCSCLLRASLIVCRRTEQLPEGSFRVIDDLLPVWWEFHTASADAGELLNDFSFDEVRQRL